MKRASNGNALLTPDAVQRLANAKAALQRAKAGLDKALGRQRASHAEMERLEALAKATARALETAKDQAEVHRPQVAAWSSVLAFAEADVPVAAKEVELAEAKDSVTRFRGEHPDGGGERERASLEEAVGRAERALESARSEHSHKSLAGEAARAERHLEGARKAETDRNRAVLIERKLAQLAAVSAKKAQERENWRDREKSLGQEISKLDLERKRLESEHKQLSARG
ncbi:MAG: hypothetical protein AB7L66_06875 [Gemmatimonadales bacterium]